MSLGDETTMSTYTLAYPWEFALRPIVPLSTFRRVCIVQITIERAPMVVEELTTVIMVSPARISVCTIRLVRRPIIHLYNPPAASYHWYKKKTTKSQRRVFPESRAQLDLI